MVLLPRPRILMLIEPHIITCLLVNSANEANRLGKGDVVDQAWLQSCQAQCYVRMDDYPRKGRLNQLSRHSLRPRPARRQPLPCPGPLGPRPRNSQHHRLLSVILPLPTWNRRIWQGTRSIHHLSLPPCHRYPPILPAPVTHTPSRMEPHYPQRDSSQSSSLRRCTRGHQTRRNCPHLRRSRRPGRNGLAKSLSQKEHAKSAVRRAEHRIAALWLL